MFCLLGGAAAATAATNNGVRCGLATVSLAHRLMRRQANHDRHATSEGLGFEQHLSQQRDSGEICVLIFRLPLHEPTMKLLAHA